MDPDAKQKADYEKMFTLYGVAFDKMFATHMVLGPPEYIAEYKKEAKMKDAGGA